MSFPGLQSLETWVSAQSAAIEAKLVTDAASIKNGIAVANADIVAGLAYIGAHLPQIETFLQTVATAVTILSGGGIPTATAASAIASALQLSAQAGAGLAAYNADIAAGKSQLVAYADLIAAFMNAKAAASTAAAATVSVPAKAA